MSIIFTAAASPFARWEGPYSVARGTKSGFRFYQDRLGSWVELRNVREFWAVASSPGTIALTQLVKQHWGSGRVLLSPDGHVMKPDPEAPAIRHRIGHVQGNLVVVRPNGVRFDMSNTQHLRPGDAWLGPPTTGIECVLDRTGRLECDLKFATPSGQDAQTITVWGPDGALGHGLQAARPGVGGARVRVQYGGAVITRSEEEETLMARYVGKIDAMRWPFNTRWVVP
jgi:hypothetical protein